MPEWTKDVSVPEPSPEQAKKLSLLEQAAMDAIVDYTKPEQNQPQNSLTTTLQSRGTMLQTGLKQDDFTTKASCEDPLEKLLAQIALKEQHYQTGSSNLFCNLKTSTIQREQRVQNRIVEDAEDDIAELRSTQSRNSSGAMASSRVQCSTSDARGLIHKYANYPTRIPSRESIGSFGRQEIPTKPFSGPKSTLLELSQQISPPWSPISHDKVGSINYPPVIEESSFDYPIVAVKVPPLSKLEEPKYPEQRIQTSRMETKGESDTQSFAVKRAGEEERLPALKGDGKRSFMDDLLTRLSVKKLKSEHLSLDLGHRLQHISLPPRIRAQGMLRCNVDNLTSKDKEIDCGCYDHCCTHLKQQLRDKDSLLQELMEAKIAAEQKCQTSLLDLEAAYGVSTGNHHNLLVCKFPDPCPDGYRLSNDDAEMSKAQIEALRQKHEEQEGRRKTAKSGLNNCMRGTKPNIPAHREEPSFGTESSPVERCSLPLLKRKGRMIPTHNRKKILMQACNRQGHKPAVHCRQVTPSGCAHRLADDHAMAYRQAHRPHADRHHAERTPPDAEDIHQFPKRFLRGNDSGERTRGKESARRNSTLNEGHCESKLSNSGSVMLPQDKRRQPRFKRVSRMACTISDRDGIDVRGLRGQSYRREQKDFNIKSCNKQQNMETQNSALENDAKEKDGLPQNFQSEVAPTAPATLVAVQSDSNLASQVDVLKMKLAEVSKALMDETAQKFTAKAALEELQKKKCDHLKQMEVSIMERQEQVTDMNENLFQHLQLVEERSSIPRSSWECQRTDLCAEIKNLKERLECNDKILEKFHLRSSFGDPDSIKGVTENVAGRPSLQLHESWISSTGHPSTQPSNEEDSAEFDEVCDAIIMCLKGETRVEIERLRDAMTAQSKQLQYVREKQDEKQGYQELKISEEDSNDLHVYCNELSLVKKVQGTEIHSKDFQGVQKTLTSCSLGNIEETKQNVHSETVVHTLPKGNDHNDSREGDGNDINLIIKNFGDCDHTTDSSGNDELAPLQELLVVNCQGYQALEADLKKSQRTIEDLTRKVRQLQQWEVLYHIQERQMILKSEILSSRDTELKATKEVTVGLHQQLEERGVEQLEYGGLVPKDLQSNVHFNSYPLNSRNHRITEEPTDLDNLKRVLVLKNEKIWLLGKDNVVLKQEIEERGTRIQMYQQEMSSMQRKIYTLCEDLEMKDKQLELLERALNILHEKVLERDQGVALEKPTHNSELKNNEINTKIVKAKNVHNGELDLLDKDSRERELELKQGNSMIIEYVEFRGDRGCSMQAAGLASRDPLMQSRETQNFEGSKSVSFDRNEVSRLQEELMLKEQHLQRSESAHHDLYLIIKEKNKEMMELKQKVEKHRKVLELRAKQMTDVSVQVIDADCNKGSQVLKGDVCLDECGLVEETHRMRKKLRAQQKHLKRLQRVHDDLRIVLLEKETTINEHRKDRVHLQLNVIDKVKEIQLQSQVQVPGQKLVMQSAAMEVLEANPRLLQKNHVEVICSTTFTNEKSLTGETRSHKTQKRHEHLKEALEDPLSDTRAMVVYEEKKVAKGQSIYQQSVHLAQQGGDGTLERKPSFGVSQPGVSIKTDNREKELREQQQRVYSLQKEVTGMPDELETKNNQLESLIQVHNCLYAQLLDSEERVQEQPVNENFILRDQVKNMQRSQSDLRKRLRGKEQRLRHMQREVCNKMEQSKMQTQELALVMEELTTLKQSQKMEATTKNSTLHTLAYPSVQSCKGVRKEAQLELEVVLEPKSFLGIELQQKDEALTELTLRCDQLLKIEKLYRKLLGELNLKNEQIEALEKIHVCLQEQAEESERKYHEEFSSIMYTLEKATNDACAREQLIEILASDLKKVKVTLERCKEELATKDKKVKDLEGEVQRLKVVVEKANARKEESEILRCRASFERSNENSGEYIQLGTSDAGEAGPYSKQQEQHELQTLIRKLKKKSEVWNLEKATLVSALQNAEKQMLNREEQVQALQEEVSKKQHTELEFEVVQPQQEQQYCTLCRTKVLGKENHRSNNRMIMALEEQLREQWEMHRVMKERMKGMKRQLLLRTKELKDAESDRDAVKAQLIHVQERACMMKCDLECQMSLLHENLLESSAQLQAVTSQLRETCHQKVSLQTNLAQSESSLVTLREGNVDVLLEKVALEDSAKALQFKSMKFLQRLTATRVQWGQNIDNAIVNLPKP